MLLINNINILKKTYPNTWNKIKALEDKMDLDFIKMEETLSSGKTIYIEIEGKKTYIHSKYNPLREAQSIIEEYEEIKYDTTVIFYGTGLGYHIDLFLEKYPQVNYYIYEPVPELLNEYLSNKSIKDLYGKKLKNIVLGSNTEETVSFLNNVIDKNRGDTLLVELPSHTKVWKNQYKDFLDLFKTILKNKKNSIYTNYAFQERWIINSMKNFGEVLSTPNILIEKKGEFKNKPAVLVAAGPSLNEEIENIRYIKENGLAYIFSVGSAINTLICNGIYPDVTCGYDPSQANLKVYKNIIKKNIREIPFIFGTSIAWEIAEKYTGCKYHMITSQDSVSRYYLKNKDSKKVDIVQDASSIAVVTVQLLHELGFNPIILAGQNLAYKGKERHSEGVFYSKSVTDEEIENGILVENVYGEQILTDDGFNRMRHQIEFYIKKFSNIQFINTTKGGANIEGTKFIELKELIEERLIDTVVEENWLDGNKTNYSIEYLLHQSRKMDKSYKKSVELIDEYYNILNKIDKLIINNKFSEIEKMYIRLDNTFSKIEKNDFFNTFILPMNRVDYKILVDSIDYFNEEKNQIQKGEKIVYSFKKFIDSCKNDIETTKHMYEEMREIILSNVL